jgi:hypothetical protein
VRKSFFQQYFSSMRSVTHGGTGMGVKTPIEKGHIPLNEKQPLSPKGASARTPSTRLRTFFMPRPFPTEIVPRAPRRARPEHRPPAPAGAFPKIQRIRPSLWRNYRTAVQEDFNGSPDCKRKAGEMEKSEFTGQKLASPQRQQGNFFLAGAAGWRARDAGHTLRSVFSQSGLSSVPANVVKIVQRSFAERRCGTATNPRSPFPPVFRLGAD